MKKIFILFLILLVVSCLGCEQAIYSMQLKQPADEISSITLVNNSGTNAPAIVLMIESDSEIRDIVADMKNLEVGKHRNDPPTSLGVLYIEICYQNGDMERIGTDMFEYTSSDGKIDESYGGWYYVKLDSMRELFAKYR